jgi:hypothetical protein
MCRDWLVHPERCGRPDTNAERRPYPNAPSRPLRALIMSGRTPWMGGWTPVRSASEQTSHLDTSDTQGPALADRRGPAGDPGGVPAEGAGGLVQGLPAAARHAGDAAGGVRPLGVGPADRRGVAAASVFRRDRQAAWRRWSWRRGSAPTPLRSGWGAGKRTLYQAWDRWGLGRPTNRPAAAQRAHDAGVAANRGRRASAEHPLPPAGGPGRSQAPSG